MSEKDKSILIRISEELAVEIDQWSKLTEQNKSALVRESVRFYLDNLKNENIELLELIRAIIITKLDKIQEEYNKGTIIAFSKVTAVSTALNCNLCRDFNNNEYIVYNIIQHENESMLDAINNYAQKLYTIWKSLSEADKSNFIKDLQQNNVYFSMKANN
jgi:predicted DNA-binding protein